MTKSGVTTVKTHINFTAFLNCWNSVIINDVCSSFACHAIERTACEPMSLRSNKECARESGCRISKKMKTGEAHQMWKLLK